MNPTRCDTCFTLLIKESICSKCEKVIIIEHKKTKIICNDEKRNFNSEENAIEVKESENNIEKLNIIEKYDNKLDFNEDL
jgi:Zn finger protein HypA/HybF involved in hydrogenase expression